ncbi:MAG TPA: radical SAM protein, partial [Acidilobales archaeon]|nr:radical SAM protein [Acidilobales archaeon]
MRIKYIRVKSALSRSGLKEIDYALNPYLGCYHSCIYCYARDFTRYEEVAKNWGEVIYVKINLLDVLRREVKRLPKGVVGVATITDPYQPIEATYRLTRGSLEILKRYGFKVSIQTKSPLVLRDKDIIEPKQFDVGVTIITMDKDVAKVVEPKAPPPTDRVRILKEISELGVETWLFMGPIIPCLTDN